MSILSKRLILDCILYFVLFFKENYSFIFQVNCFQTTTFFAPSMYYLIQTNHQIKVVTVIFNWRAAKKF